MCAQLPELCSANLPGAGWAFGMALAGTGDAGRISRTASCCPGLRVETVFGTLAG